MNIVPQIEMVSKADMAKIHEASLKILNNTGIAYFHEEAIDIFKKHGAKVEGNTVRIPESLVKEALGNCAPTFRWDARNDKNSVADINKKQIIQPNVGPCFIHIPGVGRRPGVKTDYVNIQKLFQATPVLSCCGTTPIDISDIDSGIKYQYMMYETLKNTDKLVFGTFSDNPKTLNETLDMLELGFGKKGFLNDHYCAAIGANPMSPLSWSRDTCNVILTYSKRHQIICVLPCILAGVSGPISLMEMAILQNTEILSGIVLAKLVNPACAVVYSPGSTAAYMRNCSYCTGTPEGMMLNIVNLQMGRDFYHLPIRTMSAMTDSKSVDYQAGFETMQNFMLSVLGGATFHNETMGALDSLMSFSYEKFIMDIEIVERVFRIQEGIQGFDYSFSTEDIEEVGPGGDYLVQDNTIEHMHDRWAASISDWDSYDSWVTSGKPNILDRAKKKCDEILAAAPATMINPDLDKALRKYFEK